MAQTGFDDPQYQKSEIRDPRSALNRSVIGFTFCFLAFALVAWSFYPGLMTADSIANLSSGRENAFTELGAPLMSWTWGRLDAAVPGPSLIFVIHLAMFWGGCALFWAATHGRSLGLGIALLVFGLAPHILAQTVVVWKDVALGVSLFMATALLYFARTRQSRSALLVTPIFLFYGLGARLNAFPAVLPVALWSGWIALEIFEIEVKRVAVWAVGLSYFVMLAAGVYVVNDRLVGGRNEYPFQQVYLYDLAALAANRDVSVFPPHVRNGPGFSIEAVRERYSDRAVSALIFPDIPSAGDKPPLILTKDQAEANNLRRYWFAAVSDDPISYLRHRTGIFIRLVGARLSVTDPYLPGGFAHNPPEYRGQENVGFRTGMSYFGLFRRPFSQSFFFRAFVWLALTAAFGVIALKRRLAGDWDLVFVLSASSHLFTLMYFPTAPSTEFRYLFWPAIASAVAIIFGFYLLFSKEARSN